MQFIRIILLSIAASVCYGILHDLITANLCVEYFTVGHPKIIESESPIALAFLWGVIATWWVGLIMGTLLAIVGLLGKYPPIPFSTIKKGIIRLLMVMFCLAFIAGVIGYTLTETRVIYLMPYLSERMPPEQYSKFLAAGWAHGASYLVGIVGTIVLCIRIYQKRKRHSNE